MTTGESKILLVDDSKEDRVLMAQALSYAGLECELEEASDGEEADVRLERNLNEGKPPRLVILDLILPKRSGLEVMEIWHAKGYTQRTRVVVLSSVLTENEISKLREFGAIRIFQKPIDLDEFFVLGERVKELAIKGAEDYAGTLNQNVEPSPGLDSAQSFPP
jgi:DNA-binding response OmpR family regulator